jgi:hypothetical protein
VTLRSTLFASGLLVAGFAVHAEAIPVVFNGTQVQTLDGQDFTFTFLAAPPSNGTGGTFVVHAQGDYDGAATEALTWSIEGIALGGPVGGFVGGVGVGGPFDFVAVFQPLGNLEFQVTYSLLPGALDAILADGMISIFVNLDDSVGLFQPPNFVELTLSYETGSPVPEPSTLLLLASGLAAGSRKLRSRRNRTAA